MREGESKGVIHIALHSHNEMCSMQKMLIIRNKSNTEIKMNGRKFL